MLHGFMLDKETMKGCMEPIFKKRNGWKRIYLDLPGMGSTKSADWIQNSDDILEVLNLFIKKVLGENTFFLIGKSYGGYLARGIIYTNEKNVGGMLLICPLIEPDFTKRNLLPPVTLKRDTQLFNSLSSFEQKTFQRFMVVQNKRNWIRFKKKW